MSDAERWQRAKAFIEQQISVRKFGIEAGYVSESAESIFRIEINLLEAILDRAETDVPKNP